MMFSQALLKNLRRLAVCGAALGLFGGMMQIVPAQKKKSVAAPNAALNEAEKLLADLGYWIIKADGIKDASTFHAIAAFQKVENRPRTGILTAAELTAMQTAARPAAKYTGTAHIEVDLTRQVLFLVDESGVVTHVLPVSSGNDKQYLSGGKKAKAFTPRGEYKITRQIAGIRHAPLGKMYHPNYFLGGWAIHGSGSIPLQPASHGCVRIPNFAAVDFSSLVAVGMDVFIYD